MAKPKKATTRSRSKSPTTKSKSSGRARGPLSTNWKATDSTVLSNANSEALDKKLESLISALQAKQKKLIQTKKIESEDKEINARIANVKKLRRLLEENNFQAFLSEWNKMRKTLAETRVKFLTSGKNSDKGRATVTAIETTLTKVFKASSPSKASTASTNVRRNSSSSSLSSERKSNSARSSRSNSFASNYDDEVKEEKNVSQPRSRPRYGLQNEFLAAAEKKLEIYLRHLQRNKLTPTDTVLPEKIDAVLDLLEKAKKNDINGFIHEWKRTSSVIKKHRPKSLMGHKLNFTQAFPFEGQKLVQDLEKINPDLYKASHQPSSPKNKP